MKHSDINQYAWSKLWAGGWSFLTCSHFGDQYTKEIYFHGRPFRRQVIIRVQEGKSACFATADDGLSFGQALAAEIVDNPARVEEICADLKRETDSILTWIDRVGSRVIDRTTYEEFWGMVVRYYRPHINVKFVVDQLPPAVLEKTLSWWEDARVYAEPVFKRTEEFMNMVASQIEGRTACPAHLVLCCTKEEFLAVLDGNPLPDRRLLESRYAGAILWCIEDGQVVETGSGLKEIESDMDSERNAEVKGTCAFAGKVRGTVRIILDPMAVGEFAPGDILVTGMTRPEYIPLMKQAGAIVTDAGGILCHAAIVARELKKPCIIGTEHGTKSLQEGEMVEVDAEKGIVRKI